MAARMRIVSQFIKEVMVEHDSTEMLMDEKVDEHTTKTVHHFYSTVTYNWGAVAGFVVTTEEGYYKDFVLLEEMERYIIENGLRPWEYERLKFGRDIYFKPEVR